MLQGITAKRDKQEEVIKIFSQLLKKLPDLKDSVDFFPTDNMKMVLAMIYIKILDLLQRLALYAQTHKLGI
jgi:hypothetical protein